MGAVERVLVLGIVVVIVAILGIAVWGAAGDSSTPVIATNDGGVVLTGQDTPSATSLPPVADSGAAPSTISGIDAWKQLRDQEQAARNAASGAPAAEGTAPAA